MCFTGRQGNGNKSSGDVMVTILLTSGGKN
jgi:hypothetical protein